MKKMRISFVALLTLLMLTACAVPPEGCRARAADGEATARAAGSDVAGRAGDGGVKIGLVSTLSGPGLGAGR